MLIAFVAVLLTLLLVIGVHELGHAVLARFFNIKIKRISVGFGKPLALWTSKQGCEWVLGRWFFGGYVELNNTRSMSVPLQEHDSCFDKKPIRQRILVLLAGALANMMMALVLLVIIFYFGIQYKIPSVAAITPHSMAAKAGLGVGDEIRAVAGKSTASWIEVGQALITSWGARAVPLTLKAPDGQERVHLLNLDSVPLGAHTHSLLEGLGIHPDVDASYHLVKASSFFAALQEAIKTIIYYLYFFMMMLKQLLTGVIPFSLLLGPIGLFATSINSLTQGAMIFLYFVASLNIAVAQLNLLPIPGLDGGSIVYALLEKIRGKPVSIAWELLIYRLMMVVMFLLLAQLINNDIARFVAK